MHTFLLIGFKPFGDDADGIIARLNCGNGEKAIII